MRVHVFAYMSCSYYYAPSAPYGAQKCQGASLTTSPLFKAKSADNVPPDMCASALRALGASAYNISFVRNEEYDAESAELVRAKANWSCFLNDVTFSDDSSIPNAANFHQWYKVSKAYNMMVQHEKNMFTKFDFVFRLRGDNRPLSSMEKLAQQMQTPAFRFGVCGMGDGQALMARHVSDVYFTTYRSALDLCGTHDICARSPQLCAEDPWKQLTSADYFKKGWYDQVLSFHEQRYGVPDWGNWGTGECSPNMKWWFTRPDSCTSLCRDRKPF